MYSKRNVKIINQENVRTYSQNHASGKHIHGNLHEVSFSKCMKQTENAQYAEYR